MNNVFIRPSLGEELDATHTLPSSHAPRTKSGSGYWHAPIFGLTHRANGLLALLLCCFALSGCGGSYVVKGASTASTGTVSPSPDSVDFGTVSVGQSVNSKIDVVNQGSQPVVVSQLTLSGSSFSVDGQGALPVTLAAGGTMSFKVHFNPSSDGTSTGQVTIASNSTASPTASVKLHGVGKKSSASSTITLSAFACNGASMTGSGTDACTVTLSGAAGSGGQSVGLSSDNGAVIVPATVTVPANATSASFNATVSAVSSSQTANLTATVNSSSSSVSLKLNAAVPTLAVSATTVSFGSVAVNTASKKSVTLTSTGTGPVTISSAALTGSGFTMSGVSFPVTLNPGQAATLSLQFDPSIVGAATGQLTIASNSSTSRSAVISLSGTGTASAPGLNSFTCSSGTMTGAGTDACTVTLSAAAGSGGESVSLSSSAGAVTLPASVTVPANATSVGFSATVASFSSSQAVTLTASASNSTKTFVLQLNAGTPTLGINSTNISFGNVIVGQTAKQSVTLTSTGTAAVTISSISVAGSLFTASGISAPVTLNPGQKTTLSLQFNADHVSSFAGTVTIASNSSQGNVVVNMSGSGVASPGTLSALSCISGSMSAAGTDACTVSLSAAAGSSGLNVILSSSNATVAVPASVTVPANATSASFSATVSSFTSAQTVTLSANAGGITKSFGLQLNVGGTSALTVNTSSLAFGSVVLNSPATQSVTLTSTGTTSVTVNSATLSGAGFSITGGTFPVTLNPNQSVTVNIQFDPTIAGAVTGQLTITSTSSTNSTATVSLSGTGTPHEVDLSWNAPSGSTDPVAGYNVYRSSVGGNSYQELGSLTTSQTSYVDSTVASGQAYDYVVKAFDSSRVESGPSNMTSVTIP